MTSVNLRAHNGYRGEILVQLKGKLWPLMSLAYQHFLSDVLALLFVT